MSKRAALAFGIGASLLLAAGTANAASNCSAEIDALQQQLGTDAGANATTGASDPGVQQPQPEANATAGTSTDTTTGTDTGNGSSVANSNANSGANATIGATDPGVQQPDPGASADSSSTTGSSDTMSSGSSTMPSGTVTETSRTGTLNVDPSARSAALASLEKAKTEAQAGNEDACMTDVNSAKQMLGVQ